MPLATANVVYQSHIFISLYLTAIDQENFVGQLPFKNLVAFCGIFKKSYFIPHPYSL